MKSDKSIFIDDIEIVYGITTPEIFNESKYRVAYETVVQEPEIPFITCELQTLKDNKYIGDVIFEGSKSRISNKELKFMPISEIHLNN